MTNSEQQFMQELEAHIQRVIQYHQPGAIGMSLNVRDARGGLAGALKSYIDQRIDERLAQHVKEEAEKGRV